MGTCQRSNCATLVKRTTTRNNDGTPRTEATARGHALVRAATGRRGHVSRRGGSGPFHSGGSGLQLLSRLPFPLHRCHMRGSRGVPLFLRATRGVLPFVQQRGGGGGGADATAVA